LALILWQSSLCNKLEAFSGVLEEGVSTENIDIPLGCCNNRLHSATHHPAHHSATLSTAKASTTRSALSTAEAAAGSTLTAGEPTAARSTLTTKARSSALLTRLTLDIGCLCLRCCVNGSKTSCDKRSKRDTSNYLLIHGNSP
jgi:hypothetical protein